MNFLIFLLICIPTIVLGFVTFKLVDVIKDLNGVSRTPFFNAEKKDSFDEYYGLKDVEQVPDKHYYESQEESFSDEQEEFYGTPINMVNPDVIERDRLYDEKIEAMKLELELERNKRRAGVLYEDDHDVVNRKYEPKPEYEVAN